MTAACCVRGCANESAIRQPLQIGEKDTEIVLHVPLCAQHNEQWVDIAGRLEAAQLRRARAARDDFLGLDAALAWAVMQSHHAR